MKVIRFRPAYLVLSREELITRPRTEMANHPKSFGLIPESQIRRDSIRYVNVGVDVIMGYETAFTIPFSCTT
ncbi:hypothetical protein OUZ56_031144 [Daphnia magna]|uniref:Uncharacterized protein n=1 Tax=Daphnia magna TaxID=35525 RepID=A0ABQ9ZTE0_9CRUS|nr:hypothetical protein OUZ56_031144 [Daphnia magna]